MPKVHSPLSIRPAMRRRRLLIAALMGLVVLDGWWMPPAVGAGNRFVPNAAEPMTLHSVHKLYIEPMPNGLDEYLRTAIFKKCGGFFTFVLNRAEADAILRVSDPRLPGNVTMVDQSGTLILWSGSADKKEMKYLGLHSGGEKVLAEKLAGQLKKAIS